MDPTTFGKDPAAIILVDKIKDLSKYEKRKIADCINTYSNAIYIIEDMGFKNILYRELILDSFVEKVVLDISKRKWDKDIITYTQNIIITKVKKTKRKWKEKT